MKMYTIILCLLLFNCTDTSSKKEKNNVMDEPKTIIMNNLDFKDIMKLGKLKAIKKHGKPFKEEQFSLTLGLPEFRVELLNIYTKEECQSKSIIIDELTWNKDSLNYITVWYQSDQKISLPKHFLIWNKGTEF